MPARSSSAWRRRPFSRPGPLAGALDALQGLLAALADRDQLGLDLTATLNSKADGSEVYLDGVEQLSDWSVDMTTGLVTFSMAPTPGVEITTDFESQVPVRVRYRPHGG
jgi:hypothetical protein